MIVPEDNQCLCKYCHWNIEELINADLASECQSSGDDRVNNFQAKSIIIYYGIKIWNKKYLGQDTLDKYFNQYVHDIARHGSFAFLGISIPLALS